MSWRGLSRPRMLADLWSSALWATRIYPGVRTPGPPRLVAGVGRTGTNPRTPTIGGWGGAHRYGPQTPRTLGPPRTPGSRTADLGHHGPRTRHHEPLDHYGLIMPR